MHLLVQEPKGGKRKARSEEGEEATAGSKASTQPRKAVKRAQGHTPSRKGPAPGLRGQSPAQKGPGPSPLRHLNVGRGGPGPSRLANSTHISDIENAAKAANSADQVGLPAVLSFMQHQPACVLDQHHTKVQHEIRTAVMPACQ